MWRNIGYLALGIALGAFVQSVYYATTRNTPALIYESFIPKSISLCVSIPPVSPITLQVFETTGQYWSTKLVLTGWTTPADLGQAILRVSEACGIHAGEKP